MSQNCQQMRAYLRAHVCVLQKTSMEVIRITVRLISVVPWEVVGDQVVERYSVVDLGQDSPVLCLQD